MPPSLTTGGPGLLEELFARLCRLEPESRVAWLDEQALAPSLRQELEALLEADSRAAALFDHLRPSAGGRNPSKPEGDGADGVVVGSEIARYRVVGPIGQGGMGVVVRARDPGLERDVALKLLPARAVRSADAKRRLLREARAAAALDHPNICTVYGVEEDGDGRLFVAMSYCEGETLAERLSRGPLPVSDALDVVGQLASALAAAHEAGIFHCDVKPSNLILTRTGVKLVDFGIARVVSDETTWGGARGTLSYMAPEQLRGEAPDARTDVWAAGVLLLECLTGANPFRGESEAVTIYRILTAAEVSLPAELQPRAALQRVLGRCLAPERADRFGSARELATTVRSLRDGGAGGPAIANARGAPRLRPPPRPPTRLIGRERERAALDAALGDARLVTVTGTAGTGKTHLVVDTLDRLAARYSAGVVFVPLAAVADAALVASEIGAAFGLQDRSPRLAEDVLADHIGDRELLLVLDNLEQVSQAAPLLAELLARCPGLRILATSRVALRLRGEQELPLDPLPVPPAGVAATPAELAAYPATALFLERARAVRPQLVLDEAAAEAVAGICRRLDGLPLAIELAAARLRLFSPAALLERLAQPLVVLDDAARDVPGRHRALRDAIAWSYRLLEPGEQRVFRLAGVFAGGIELEALEAVCGALGTDADGVAVATRLVEHSLLRADAGSERPRLTMLRTIREYAVERLADERELEAARLAHAEYHLRIAEKAARGLLGGEQASSLERLEREHENLRAALDWAERSRRGEIALPMAAALCRFWVARGHVREARGRLDRLVAMQARDAPAPARAALLASAGALAHETGDFRGAQPLLRRALKLYRQAQDGVGMAGALNALAWTHAHTSSLERAESVARHALNASRASGDPRALGVALHNLSWIAVYRGQARTAIEHADAAIRVRDGLGDGRGAAFTLSNRARAERQAGDRAAARASLDAARRSADALDDGQLHAMLAMVTGQVLLDEGEAGLAAESLRIARDLWQSALHEFALGDCLNWLAAAELELGRPDAAARLLADADAIWQRVQGPWGRAATLFRRGQLERRSGAAAVSLLQEGLALRRRIGDLLGQAECLEELALCRSAGVSDAQALLAAAAELRVALGTPRPRGADAGPGPGR